MSLPSPVLTDMFREDARKAYGLETALMAVLPALFNAVDG